MQEETMQPARGAAPSAAPGSATMSRGGTQPRRDSERNGEDTDEDRQREPTTGRVSRDMTTSHCFSATRCAGKKGEHDKGLAGSESPAAISST